VIDNWHKATYSVDNSACVETGWSGDVVGYRDTKQPDRPALLFSRTAARAFLAMITR
jgi:Domain of unknown function (DUF397)